MQNFQGERDLLSTSESIGKNIEETREEQQQKDDRDGNDDVISYSREYERNK